MSRHAYCRGWSQDYAALADVEIVPSDAASSGSLMAHSGLLDSPVISGVVAHARASSESGGGVVRVPVNIRSAMIDAYLRCAYTHPPLDAEFALLDPQIVLDVIDFFGNQRVSLYYVDYLVNMLEGPYDEGHPVCRFSPNSYVPVMARICALPFQSHAPAVRGMARYVRAYMRKVRTDDSPVRWEAFMAISVWRDVSAYDLVRFLDHPQWTEKTRVPSNERAVRVEATVTVTAATANGQCVVAAAALGQRWLMSAEDSGNGTVMVSFELIAPASTDTIRCLEGTLRVTSAAGGGGESVSVPEYPVAVDSTTPAGGDCLVWGTCLPVCVTFEGTSWKFLYV